MGRQAKRYVWCFGATFSLALLCACLLSLYVDPYRLFDAPGHLADAAPRPRAAQHVDLVKTHGIARAQPHTLILGNSRAEIGLDPRSSAWPAS
jgi:hypothetical protein